MVTNQFETISLNSGFTRVLWIDYSGLARCKIVPNDLLKNNVLLTKVGMVLTYGDCPAEKHRQLPSGEVRMLPYIPPGTTQTNLKKLLQLTNLPWHPNHSLVIAELYELDGSPWIHCPVNCLKRVIQRFEERNLKVLAGFEMEFVIYKSHTANYSAYEKSEVVRSPLGACGFYGSHQQADIAAGFLDDLVNTLNKMNIPVRMMHAESGFGQFEVVLTHTDVVTSVKKLVIAREAVRAIARKHELQATFCPVGLQGAGSGCHVHISLEDHFGTDNQLYGYHVGMDETAQSFVAGIVDALPWLCAFTDTNPLSYQRIQPKYWVGAYQSWGINNKETPIRLAADRTNFEYKLLDSATNPFLALAAMLAVGLDGIDNKMQLSQPHQMDPSCLPISERPPRLPKSVSSQIALIEAQKGTGSNFDTLIHEEMIHDYLKVALQLEQLQKTSPEKFRSIAMNHI